jgi:hypothetical protein
LNVLVEFSDNKRLLTVRYLELEDFLLSSSPSELVLEYTSEAFSTFFFFFRPEQVRNRSSSAD